MRQLTVIYDSQCGLCSRVQAWLLNQPKFVDLIFVPVNSEEAHYRYPQLNHAMTAKDVTVISDGGGVYWGPKAWLMCLWALKSYREWSFRLSSPELLPTTRRVVAMISQNRHALEGMGKLLLRTNG
ncbi:MAG TPA: DCC1-like thiol-disulfide oxidoreductase family protein [Blastocatellia bacterium]|nr:DCC1-like thiol-disulfide oxidoreductase family protein [Blastocatellia bacterium]